MKTSIVVVEREYIYQQEVRGVDGIIHRQGDVVLQRKNEHGGWLDLDVWEKTYVPLNHSMVAALKLVTAAKRHPSQRFLDTLYGPQAAKLRAEVATLLLGRRITHRDKPAQWTVFRQMLVREMGVTGTCTADVDEKFEAAARTLLES